MVFAFVCHVISTIMTIFTTSIAKSLNIEPYWVLYIAMFIVALGNGTVKEVSRQESSRWRVVITQVETDDVLSGRYDIPVA